MLGRRASKGDGRSPAEAAQQPFWTRARIASAVLIAAVIVLIPILLLGDGGDDSPTALSPQQREPPQAPSEDTDQQGAVSDSRCGLPDGDQEIPESPPQAEWELVGSMAAPTDPEIGPGETEQGIGVCFQRSPVGALYAAVNLWASMTDFPLAEVVRVLAAENPAKHRALREEAREPTPRLDSNGRLQLAGFAVTGYEAGDTAAITLAFRKEGGALAQVPTSLRWERGDWRWVISFSEATGVTQIPDLSGFTEWGGA